MQTQATANSTPHSFTQKRTINYLKNLATTPTHPHRYIYIYIHIHTHTHSSVPKGVQGKWTEGVEFFYINVSMRFYFLEGQIVSHVCVKGLNNNVNSFCTEEEKHTFLTI